MSDPHLSHLHPWVLDHAIAAARILFKEPLIQCSVIVQINALHGITHVPCGIEMLTYSFHSIMITRHSSMLRQPLQMTWKRMEWNEMNKLVCTDNLFKSDYSLLKQWVKVKSEEPSNPNSSKALWRAVWTANISNKIKIFNWRELHNILPTKVNLFEKKISFTYSYELCEKESKTRIHILWTCSEAQSVWSMILGITSFLEH